MGHGETAKGTPKLCAFYHGIWGIVARGVLLLFFFLLGEEENMKNSGSFWSHKIGKKMEHG